MEDKYRNNAHTEQFSFQEAPLKDPQLSETAVNLININCSNIKTPVTLRIVPHLLVKHKFTVFIQEIKVAHTRQEGLGIYFYV